MQDVGGSGMKHQYFTETLLALIPKLPPRPACSLANVSVLREYDPGSMVLKEGEPSGGIFLLLEGAVDRWMSGLSATEKKWIKLPRISSPAVLGITSCMLGEPSAISVSAVSKVTALFIDQKHLLRVVQECPEAALALSQLVSEELVDTYAHLTELRSSSIPKQLSPLLN